jgi:poly-beta-1,6-N-acetyl-D-glucosamine biosynthesis protein PgaD
MSAHLIIDARHRLRWHQRLVSDASTALLWTVWIWLWSPLLQALGSVAHLGARLGPALAKLSALGSAAGGLHHPMVVLVGASGTLLVWKGVPAARREVPPPALTVREHARHHRLPEHVLREAREASICVVHHDAQGRVVRLEPRAARPLAARRSA